MLSYYNTSDEIKKSGVDTAVIPIGSIEQHGPHLPIGMDHLAAKTIAKGIAEKIGALLYPSIPFSTCYEHKGSKGTLCMRPITLYQVLQDLVLNLREQGINKVIFYIWHGGVFIAGPAIRELNALYDDVTVLLVSEVTNNKIEALFETKGEMHAGEEETSLMLYLAEETVRKDKMMDAGFMPSIPRNFLNYVPIPKISKTGVWGNPSKASYEKGKLLYEYVVEEAVRYINEAFKVVESCK